MEKKPAEEKEGCPEMRRDLAGANGDGSLELLKELHGGFELAWIYASSGGALRPAEEASTIVRIAEGLSKAATTQWRPKMLDLAVTMARRGGWRCRDCELKEGEELGFFKRVKAPCGGGTVSRRSRRKSGDVRLSASSPARANGSGSSSPVVVIGLMTQGGGLVMSRRRRQEYGGGLIGQGQW